MSDPFTGADALGYAITEIFDIPEANLDGQMLEMASGDTSYQEQPSGDTSSGTNANSHDGGIDAALIDLLPF